MGWQNGSKDRVPVQQLQGFKFNPQYFQKREAYLVETSFSGKIQLKV
jgi:hypothetical protein